MRSFVEAAILILMALWIHSTAVAQNIGVHYPLWMQCGPSTVYIVSARPHKLGGLFEIAPPFDISGKAPIGPNDIVECKFASGKIMKIETTQEPERERGECAGDRNNDLKISLDGRVVLEGNYASCFDIEPFAAIFIDERKNSIDVCRSSRKPASRGDQEMRQWVAVRCETDNLQ